MNRRSFISSAAASVAFLGGSTDYALALSGRINDPNENKRLRLRNPHNSETISATFWRGGWFDQGALRELNHFMRDWRRDELTQIDPYLYELLYSVCADVGYTKEALVLSAYRTRETNDWLRRNPRYSAAKNSMHILGRAVDFTLPSKSIRKVKDAARRLNDGGVGYYPNQYFVHMDTGPKRRWVG